MNMTRIPLKYTGCAVANNVTYKDKISTSHNRTAMCQHQTEMSGPFLKVVSSICLVTADHGKPF